MIKNYFRLSNTFMHLMKMKSLQDDTSTALTSPASYFQMNRGGGVRKGKEVREESTEQEKRKTKGVEDNATFPSSLYYLLPHPPLTLNEG